MTEKERGEDFSVRIANGKFTYPKTRMLESADYCADLRQSCAGGRSDRAFPITAVVCIIKSQRCDRKIVVAPLRCRRRCC
jgi:hypothetical protein